MSGPVDAPPPGGAARSRLTRAVLTSILMMASAYALSLALRRAEAQTSRQQPTPEAWLEPSTPRSPALDAKGRKLFLASCAHCHGADATGDEGPDLHQLEVSDRFIANTILRGIKGEMPSFAKKHDAADRAALTSYLRSLE
jgi:mono/diheme cytochrome c family protein